MGQSEFEAQKSMMARAFQVVDFPKRDVSPADGACSEFSETKTSKISPQFCARLNQLEPQQKIRAIVLLETGQRSSLPSRRQTYDERKVAIAHLRQAAQGVMSELNTLLQNFDGRSLAKAPDALGSVPVELSAAGITALAALPWVRAVLEDQGIHAARHVRLQAAKI